MGTLNKKPPTIDEMMDSNRKAISIIKEGLEVIDNQQRHIWLLLAFCGAEALFIAFLSYRIFIGA